MIMPKRLLEAPFKKKTEKKIWFRKCMKIPMEDGIFENV